MAAECTYTEREFDRRSWPTSPINHDPDVAWRQWGGARERNIGWRIDDVFASPAAMRRIHEAFLWPDERGSDHCPVGVDIDL